MSLFPEHFRTRKPLQNEAKQWSGNSHRNAFLSGGVFEFAMGVIFHLTRFRVATASSLSLSISFALSLERLWSRYGDLRALESKKPPVQHQHSPNNAAALRLPKRVLIKNCRGRHFCCPGWKIDLRGHSVIHLDSFSRRGDAAFLLLLVPIIRLRSETVCTRFFLRVAMVGLVWFGHGFGVERLERFLFEVWTVCLAKRCSLFWCGLLELGCTPKGSCGNTAF